MLEFNQKENKCLDMDAMLSMLLYISLEAKSSRN